MSEKDELELDLDLSGSEEDENVDVSELSIDDVIRSTREALEEADELMGEDSGTETDSQKPSVMPAFAPEQHGVYTDHAEEYREDDGDEEDLTRQRLPAALRVLLYVCCVLASSILLAVFAWSCADDVLALTKPDRIAEVSIEEGHSISQVVEELSDNGLINKPWLFKLYCMLSHAEEKIEPGVYTLNNVYDYHAIINAMQRGAQERATVTVTITEGRECEDIFEELAEKGVCSVEDLEEAAANYAFDYDFLTGLPYGEPNRLEGYLFPDTYEFYLDDDPENVLSKFLRNFDRKLTVELRAQVDALNTRLAESMQANGFTRREIEENAVTLHDVIIVASLVEKETAKTSESAGIAAVIYNRLTSKQYPCLQIDAAIQYVLDERKEVLTNADKSILSPYNTYTNPGLPVGPISNPGIGSIRAALYPTDADYYFYALGKDGVHHFSETYYEHQNFLKEMENDG